MSLTRKTISALEECAKVTNPKPRDRGAKFGPAVTGMVYDINPKLILAFHQNQNHYNYYHRNCNNCITIQHR